MSMPVESLQAEALFVALLGEDWTNVRQAMQDPPFLSRLLGYYPGNPVKRQAVAVTGNAAGIGDFGIAQSALVQVQAAAVRWTLDGTPPAAATGFRNDPNDWITLAGPASMRGFQVVNEGATAATLEVVTFS